MGTKRVGVRELKENAPALVRRASRGERIVITRHGKAEAVLGPAELDTVRQGSTRLAEFETERAAFHRLLPALLRKHRGKYVAIHGGAAIDVAEDPDVLFDRIWERLEGRTFFIGRVGAPPDVIDMPGFEVE